MTQTILDGNGRRDNDKCLYCDTPLVLAKQVQFVWADSWADEDTAYCPKCLARFAVQKMYAEEFYIVMRPEFSGVLAAQINMVRVANGLRPLRKNGGMIIEDDA